MRGDTTSIENVQEVARLLRLEKLRADFNRAVISLAAFMLAVIVLYVILTMRRPAPSSYQQNAFIAVIFSTFDYLSLSEGRIHIIHLTG